MQISHPKQSRLGLSQLDRIRWANDRLQPPTLVNTSLIAFSGGEEAGDRHRNKTNSQSAVSGPPIRMDSDGGREEAGAGEGVPET